MIIKRKKLWQNKYFDVRSYEIERAKEKMEDLVCIYQDKQMTIPFNEIDKRKLLLNKKVFLSKINPDQFYQIYSFLWSPNK